MNKNAILFLLVTLATSWSVKANECLWKYEVPIIISESDTSLVIRGFGLIKGANEALFLSLKERIKLAAAHGIAITVMTTSGNCNSEPEQTLVSFSAPIPNLDDPCVSD